MLLDRTRANGSGESFANSGPGRLLNTGRTRGSAVVGWTSRQVHGRACNTRGRLLRGARMVTRLRGGGPLFGRQCRPAATEGADDTSAADPGVVLVNRFVAELGGLVPE